MALSASEAHRLEKKGKSVIVVCAACSRQVWTDRASYNDDHEEWVCSECCIQAVEAADCE